ncbi:MAG TPA: MBL fold metallo-hydrolase [Acidimicrobiales bacterium]|jgi:glyoxylase-like metal-dependent hydrolase (beta-lactamase superfamily II)|nr:MBL fold metallo-hydrolase [Acidimicrobiales bacterium]
MATERPRRQEQEKATDEITEVAPGVLRLQLPIELPGLGHVNCYAIEDERGVALVDPGLPGPKPYQTLKARVEAAGFPLERVHTVIVTHSHHDHFGGAPQLAKDTGADIVTHESFRLWWDAGQDGEELIDAPTNADGSLADPDRRQAPWGGERPRPPRRVRVKARVGKLLGRNWWRAPTPTVRLTDAETIKLGGREWVAVHTPGHTSDHLCLFDPTEGVLLSGDHVLPTITPHIGGVGMGRDPLLRFFQSLERMHTLDGVNHVLPAHGHPFTDLGGRADAIRRHHEERLDKLRKAIDGLGPSDVTGLSHELFQPRSWGPMAESETWAHLEHLRLIGDAERDEVAGRLIYRTA